MFVTFQKRLFKLLFFSCSYFFPLSAKKEQSSRFTLGCFFFIFFCPTTFHLCYSTTIQNCSNSEAVIRSALKYFFQRYETAEKFLAQGRVSKNKGIEVDNNFLYEQKEGGKKQGEKKRN